MVGAMEGQRVGDQEVIEIVKSESGTQSSGAKNEMPGLLENTNTNGKAALHLLTSPI